MKERRIIITIGGLIVNATLNHTVTAGLVWDALPITGSGTTWGDEIYFRTGIVTGDEDGQEIVEMGALAYWPPGQAICLFYGPTPMSDGEEIRPVSAVNVFGKIDGDPTVLKVAKSGAAVSLSIA
ncbi:cyclophilin-like fold protein [Dehalococcoidia bacterium]|nr:cyclophilin-like fold protein [Dehalococcoidia bacterium]